MKNPFRQAVLKESAYHLDQPRHQIKLNQNESPWDIPAVIKRKILAKLGKIDWNRYPSSDAALLKKQLARELKWKPEGIVVTNGSNVLTQAVVAATSVRGKIVLPDPTFSLYALYGRLFENKVIKVPLERDFSLDPDRFVSAIKRHKPSLVCIPNPNAPTGNLFPKRDLLKIIRAAPGLVLVDEAYYPFSGETLLPSLKRFKNLVLLRTFSKAMSLGGARVGYLIGHPQIAGEISKLVAPFCLNGLSELIVCEVMKEKQWLKKVVGQITNERERVYQALQEIPGIEPFPSAANFVLFRSKKSKTIYKRFVKKGILIRDVSDGKRLKDCLRVTIGTAKENNQFLSNVF